MHSVVPAVSFVVSLPLKAEAPSLGAGRSRHKSGGLQISWLWVATCSVLIGMSAPCNRKPKHHVWSQMHHERFVEEVQISNVGKGPV